MRRGKHSVIPGWFKSLTPPKITAIYLISSSFWLVLVHSILAIFERPRPIWTWVSSSVDALGVICTALIVYFLCKRLEERHHESEMAIREQAARDGLTGLYNRQAFDELMTFSVHHAKRHSESLALFFLDLDRFKSVNDTYGHVTGDALLRETARRLSANCLRAGDDVLARLGGDEFVMLLRAPTMPDGPRIVAERVLAALTRPYLIDGHTINSSASIGISLYPADSRDAGELVRMADQALYQTKQQGRAGYCFYGTLSKAQMDERMQLEQGLRRAVLHDELFLVYQPKVDTTRMRVVGVEALLRWRHPHLGELSAGSFVTLAEQSGLIWPITRWVVRAACRQAALWYREEGLDVNVAVNMSPLVFAHDDLVRMIEEALQENAVPPDRLTLEITEGTLMHYEARAVTVLEHFGRMGIQIHIDDFGTGYSSLASLKNFRFQALKIDRSLVRDVVTCSDDAVIATTVMLMAKSLNMEAIAEGVESEEQRDFLRSIDCRLMQGYYFARPLTAEAATEFVARFNGRNGHAQSVTS